MGKLVLFMVTSVDGYYEGMGHDISWHMVDDEFNDFAIKQMNEFRALMFGRKTYDLMHSYWPEAINDQSLSPEDRQIGQLMDDMPKYVVSRSLKRAEWRGATLISNDVPEEVATLKAQDGDIAIFGSNNLCVSLMEAGLIDEFRIMTCPVAIGTGNPLFMGLTKRQDLVRSKVQEFANGNILVTYQKA